MSFPIYLFLILSPLESVNSFLIQKSLNTPDEIYSGLSSGRFCISLGTNRTISSSLGSGYLGADNNKPTSELPFVNSLDYNQAAYRDDYLSSGKKDCLLENFLNNSNVGLTSDEKQTTITDIRQNDTFLELDINVNAPSKKKIPKDEINPLLRTNYTSSLPGHEIFKNDCKEDFNNATEMDHLEKKVNSFKPFTTFNYCKDNTTNVKIGNSSVETLAHKTTTPSSKLGIFSSSDNKFNPTVDSSGYVLYVVNLSLKTTYSQLEEVFSEFGTVKKIYIPIDRDTKCPRGFGFVTMSTMEEMYKAIEVANGRELCGRIIYVKEAKSTRMTDSVKLYVGNLSFDTSKETLKDFFSQYGFVRDIFIPIHHLTHHPRGFAFITMSSKDAKKAVENANGFNLMGRTLEVNKSLPRGQKAQRNFKKQEVKIYVGNLAFDACADNLHSLFEIYGNILDMYFPVDQCTGRTRGFAFITMEPGSADRAIECLDGYELDGRKLRVNEARPKFYNGTIKNNIETENISSDRIHYSDGI